jgi:5-methylcytosine-specific restriction endonuclease McrA
MAKPIGIGVLFPRDAHKTFMDVTRSRYSGMVERLKRKELPPLDFDLDAFRADVLGVLGGKEDGVVVCRYCKMYFGVEDIAVDHAQPLSRGGKTGLSNLDYPCKRCNDIKGSLTIDELLKLIEFLEKEIPLARQDVLSRLQKAVALAAGARADMAIKGELKKSGAWGQVQKARRDRKKAKESGLGRF